MRSRILDVCRLAAAAALITAATACETQTPSIDYYVGVQGSDTTGDGSKASPWRHIQYAVDNANKASEGVLVIHLEKGIYEENLVVKRPLQIVGAGAGPASTLADDPLTPVQDVSVIIRQEPADNPGVLIQDAQSVQLRDLVIWGGGLRAVNTRFTMHGVEVQQSRGLYGIQVEDCFLFHIEDSKVMTAANIRSDYGMDIIATDATIVNTYVGDLFDHAINIHPFDQGTPPDPFKPYDARYVAIRDSTIEGSDVYYADGIRVHSSVNLDVYDTTISRTHSSNEPQGAGTAHNPPYAAIELNGYLTKDNIEGQIAIRADIDGATLSGFDVGIGISVASTNVIVANSGISGVSAAVHSTYHNYTNAIFPTIDFGGGSLGSPGKNTFDTTSPFAFYHDAPYDVVACENEWGVVPSEIDSKRIHDRLDAAGVGRVTWSCQNG